jgi:hypothetical protein
MTETIIAPRSGILSLDIVPLDCHHLIATRGRFPLIQEIKLKIDIQELLDAVEADENIGFCIACGEQADGVEPDARRYECECCGERAVFGAEELLLGQS